MDKLKQWVALAVLGSLAIVAGGWFMLVSPKRAEAVDLRAQAEAQETTNTTLRTQLDILKAQAKELPKKQADLARVAAKIPDNPGLPALIRALTAAGTSAGVELISVTPGSPEPVVAAVATVPVDPAAAPAAPVAGAPAAAPAGELANIPISINVVGGYFEVAQFVASLEELPRALRVRSLALTPGDSPNSTSKTSTSGTPDGRSITSTITGSIYMATNRTAAAPVVAPTAAPAS